MSLYFFHLHAGASSYRDTTGTGLADLDSARAHAIVVSRELLRNNETRARSWRLEVCSADHEPCFELVLAEVDETLAVCPADLKNAVCRAATGAASLSKEISAVQLNVERLRRTLRRAEGGLSLATLNGTRL